MEEGITLIVFPHMDRVTLNISGPLQVEASITPTSKTCVAVQFQTFKIFGLIPVKAPPSARGTLDTTYLDDDMRISRGDRGACCCYRNILIIMRSLNLGHCFSTFFASDKAYFFPRHGKCRRVTPRACELGYIIL